MPIPGITAIAPITNIGDDADTITNITNGPNLVWQLIAVIGWMAPSPNVIWREFKSIVAGMFNWVLRLFGRGR